MIPLHMKKIICYDLINKVRCMKMLKLFLKHFLLWLFTLASKTLQLVKNTRNIFNT